MRTQAITLATCMAVLGTLGSGTAQAGGYDRGHGGDAVAGLLAGALVAGAIYASHDDHYRSPRHHGYKSRRHHGYKSRRHHGYKSRRHHGYKYRYRGHRGGYKFRYRGGYGRRGHGGYSRSCHKVSKHGYYHGRKARIGGTMCYGRHGKAYIVRGSRYVIDYY